MTLKARAGVLILVVAVQITGPSAHLTQRDAGNNDLASGVHKTSSSEELKSEIRDFVKHENRDHTRLRNRDRKFYEDEINYFKALMRSSETQDEQKLEKGKHSDSKRKGFPKTYNKDQSEKTLSRIKRQAVEQNDPHFVMPRSASYSTGYVNLQPNGPFMHHVAVNVPNFPYHPQMQPFPAQAPVATYSQSFPYQSSSVNNIPPPLSHSTYQRSILPNSREVNLQLLKSENGGVDIERAPRTFGSVRNRPTSFGRADSGSNLLGERFQSIDGSPPFGGGLMQNNPILDSINQNLDRSRIQMLEQQIRIRDDRLRRLEQELMENCNRQPDIFAGGRQNNFDGILRMPDFGSLRGRPNVMPQLPLSNLQDMSPLRSGAMRPMFQGRSKANDQEEDFASPQFANIDEGTELDQIQKAKEFDFNKQPIDYDNSQDRRPPGIIQGGRPSISNPTHSKISSPVAGKSDLLPNQQKHLAGAAENTFQPKSAAENDEVPIPNTVVNESGQFVDGQWLPPARQQFRNNEGTPFCVPAPAQASSPSQRNNEEQETSGNTQDLDKDQQKIVLETLEQAVKPLMKSIDAIKENGLDVEEPVVTRPIPKLKDLLPPKAMLPPPRKPSFRSSQLSDDEDAQPTGSLPNAAAANKPEVPRILTSLKALGDDQTRATPNIFRGTAPNEPRPLIDALEKMRSNRKEILQDLAENLKPLERPGLLGLTRPLTPQEFLSTGAVEQSVPQIENEEGSQVPLQTTEERLGQTVGSPISKQPSMKQSNFDHEPSENSAAIAAPKKLPHNEVFTTNEEPESTVSDNHGSGLSSNSPRMKTDESDGLDAILPKKPKQKTNSGKHSEMMDLDSLRRNTPIGETDQTLQQTDAGPTASPRENETDSDENFVDMEVEKAAPMPRNKETTTKEPEITMCQNIIKEIVTREMENHAHEDTNPAMFINKNFTNILMNRVNVEVAKYHRDHATDGLDFKGTCDDADMKLEIVSQVLLMLNKWIQEAPSAVETGTNALTAGQISELRSLLDS